VVILSTWIVTSIYNTNSCVYMLVLSLIVLSLQRVKFFYFVHSFREFCECFVVLELSTCIVTNSGCIVTNSACVVTYSTCIVTNSACVVTYSTCIVTNSACVVTYSTCNKR
jgi:hypothetical protein